MDELRICDGLTAYSSYWDASQEKRDRNCNGAGTAGWRGALVPDTIYGLNINAAANIHDWDYAVGESLAHKKSADFRFQKNMISIIRRAARRSWVSWFLKIPREYRAFGYYLAVSETGSALEAFRASEFK
tara:strand:- start:650 stop:1039 length:390 start_codon:yes stop_codon:yes gene_type:complete